MTPIKLPIFFKTEESETAKLIPESYNLVDVCKEKKMIFYVINAIAPYYENDCLKYTSIFSNGEEFICSLLPKQVELIISDALKEQ